LNNKVIRILPLIFVTILVSTPLPAYAKGYRSTVEITSSLVNECSSEQGSTNCANNNADTVGDENIVSPQISQSSQFKTGSDEFPGPPGPPGSPGPSSQARDLIYTVAEVVPPSDIALNRIGSLADPYNIELNSDVQDSENPSVAVSGNNVYVVWDSDSSEILYKRSIDGRASFGDIITLSDGIIDTTARNPVVSVAENDVYVVWADEDAILLRKSTNGGASFAGPVMVSTLTTPFSVNIDMAVVENSVYLVWSEIITGDGEDPREVFFSRSVDGGNTFSEKENLSNNNTDPGNPAIAVNQNQIMEHVVKILTQEKH
jgi:hypothetical protein